MKISLKVNCWLLSRGRFQLFLSVCRRWKSEPDWTDYPTYRYASMWISLPFLRSSGFRWHWNFPIGRRVCDRGWAYWHFGIFGFHQDLWR